MMNENQFNMQVREMTEGKKYKAVMSCEYSYVTGFIT